MSGQIVNLAAYRASNNRARHPEHLSHSRGKHRGDRRTHPRHGACEADRRSEPRYPVESKRVPAMALQGRILACENVSRNGLLAAADVPARPGERVLLHLTGCRPLSARIVWKEGGLMGLEVPLGSTELR